jgi:hypothetical protein
MRALKIILGVASVAILLLYPLFAFWLCPYRYLRFMHRDTAYYTQVAHACDVIKQQHPVSPYDSVTLSSGLVLPYTLKLSGGDPSLPKIIRALHANPILVSTNRVWMKVAAEWGRAGFGLIWEREEMVTNNWALSTAAEGLSKTVYEEPRN